VGSLGGTADWRLKSKRARVPLVVSYGSNSKRVGIALSKVESGGPTVEGEEVLSEND